MKKIDNFVNVYKVTKTLKFKLIPVGKTKENFDKNKILENDKERAENYNKAKKIIDKFFNEFINNCLNRCIFDKKDKKLKEYFNLLTTNDKNDKSLKSKIEELEKALREKIISSFKEDSETFKKLFSNKSLLEMILEDKKISDEDKEVIGSFDGFSTYFTGFLTNRQNIFGEKVGSIAYRCINDNLKGHIDNIKKFNKIKSELRDEIKQLEKEQKKVLKDFTLNDIFSIDYFDYCLMGCDIVKYNEIIGGYTDDKEKKIKGLNEYINLHKQQFKDSKLPLFKNLKKQILNEDTSDSFRFDVVETDEQLLKMLKELSSKILNNKFEILNDIDKTLFKLKNDKYDNEKIFIDMKKINDISVKCYSDYNVIKSAISNNYDTTNVGQKNIKKYEKDKEKYFKDLKCISLDFIDRCIKGLGEDYENKIKVKDKLYEDTKKCIEEVKSAVYEFVKIDKDIHSKENIQNIKMFLDSLMSFYKISNYFYEDSNIEKDLEFYGDLSKFDELDDIITIYNKVRNYLTKKPYKKDKIKINFNCSTLLKGWDVNKEKDNLGIIMIKDNNYYLGIMNKESKQIFTKYNQKPTTNYYKKINYKLLPGSYTMLPKVFLSKKGIEQYKPSNEIINNYNRGTHKKGDLFNLKDMRKLIDYFKKSITLHEDYVNFNFKFSDTNSYENISDFYREVDTQGYKITFTNINSEYIDELINNGDLYLFQIYNKDFSKYSKGVKNLHTLYFEQLFSEKNLKNIVYKLNGEAEIFYREKSIEYKVTHKKNELVANKNPNNDKKNSIFKYDLVKDKRFTEDSFYFHVPITINFKSENNLYNDKVNEAIKDCKDNYVIGIDRGERNLIYISVISENKGLIEQISFNNIINEYNKIKYETDYHYLLEEKEKERDDAKKSWDTITNIKELKEGYVSQVVHKICELVEKYDAIIVMENLNLGFKNSRVKVDKQVYQKFEKMLIDKLNLYINKKYEIDKIGGLLKGYQLTNPYQGDKNMQFQNGFIYYINPWNTSKIDPTTGFVNLFRLGYYQTMKSKKEFINKIDSIKYNNKEDVFEFAFDYNNFEYGSTDYKSKWTITSYGKRILTSRNKEKNNYFDDKEIYPTDELKTLFDKYEIDYSKNDLKENILKIENKEFFDKIFNILKLILQMRNSKTNSPIDYLISPVKNKKGVHYNSDDAKLNNFNLPHDADSNGAYNIARKGLMIIDRIKKGQNTKLTIIEHKEWLEYAQTHLPT